MDEGGAIILISNHFLEGDRVWQRMGNGCEGGDRPDYRVSLVERSCFMVEG